MIIFLTVVTVLTLTAILGPRVWEMINDEYGRGRYMLCVWENNAPWPDYEIGGLSRSQLRVHARIAQEAGLTPVYVRVERSNEPNEWEG